MLPTSMIFHHLRKSPRIHPTRPHENLQFLIDLLQCCHFDKSLPQHIVQEQGIIDHSCKSHIDMGAEMRIYVFGEQFSPINDIIGSCVVTHQLLLPTRSSRNEISVARWGDTLIVELFDSHWRSLCTLQGTSHLSHCASPGLNNHSDTENTIVFDESRALEHLREIEGTNSFDKATQIHWEFPGGFDRQRQHFSQLLHEIRREYQREHRTYLLTVAVAAPRPIIDVAYDVGEINSYADFINVMTYDYHFYAPSTPFTGINAPLFPRENEKGLLGMLNINYTANYWLERGMDKDKIVIGLPTYGHSFRLANPLNRHIGSPSTANGATGVLGFTSYSEVCWFQQNNIFVTTVYDNATCSPYTTAGTEWISYDDVVSLECKTKWVKDSDFGGVMIYSLNADDHGLYCRRQGDALVKQETFPLSRKIHSVLFIIIKFVKGVQFSKGHFIAVTQTGTT
uniref:Uncharacterized protein n=1 Tax=Phlebotomus papatasi TaxID=29031 RepID=A0A1B0D0S8_PHLPP